MLRGVNHHPYPHGGIQKNQWAVRYANQQLQLNEMPAQMEAQGIEELETNIPILEIQRKDT